MRRRGFFKSMAALAAVPSAAASAPSTVVLPNDEPLAMRETRISLEARAETAPAAPDRVGEVEVLDEHGRLIGRMPAFGKMEAGQHLSVRESTAIRGGKATSALLRTLDGSVFPFRFEGRGTWIEAGQRLTCFDGLEVVD